MTAVVSPAEPVTATLTSTTPSKAGTAATTGGGVLGVLIAVAGVVGNFTKHGNDIANGLTVLGGSGLSIGALWALVKHHKPVERVEAWGHAVEVKAETLAGHLEPEALSDLRGLRLWYTINRAALDKAAALATTDFPAQAAVVKGLVNSVTDLEAKVPAADRTLLTTIAEDAVHRLVLPQVIVPDPAAPPLADPNPDPAPAVEPATEPVP